jgi:hypothetical protein
MVARQLWPDQGPTKIQRSRTRDLSRQFRGEKAIEWRVIEIYVDLLFGATEPMRAAELVLLRELHTQAFGTTVEPDGAPSPEPENAPIDPAFVADLERQLQEARTRASFATALLVIVQAENAALRGRNSSFDWFTQPRRASASTAAETPEAGSRQRTGRRATDSNAPTDSPAGRRASGRTGGTRSGTDATAGTRTPAGSTARTGRREPGSRPETDANRPTDPATTPIVRRQGYRATPRRRPGPSRSALADAFPSASRVPAHSAAATTAPPSAPAAPARGRSASSSLHRVPAPEPPADDSGLDVLVSHEKRRRGKSS